ncbi:MAG: hypothetical protein JRG76_12170 [Deltaproteobacteria bacterium]|nr:hypothetical protein [Deltaproteobacteria bacterium]MBW2415253.1 hypothetical protein [Deltaproteobacteria bacterium]
MLLPLYPDAETRAKILADPQTAPIPDLHKEMFRFCERFVRASWEMTPDDLQRLRDAGLTEAQVVLWATLGSTQSWFTMSADGGGIPMERDAMTGPGVGKARADYEASPEGLLAPATAARVGVTAPASDSVAWVGTDETLPLHKAAADEARERYGFVPNLLRALSLQPTFHPRHLLALELLERPQSQTLTPRLHALIRARVSHLTRSAYGAVTTRALLERVTGDVELWDRLGADTAPPEADPVERVVLDFATKVARNAYKVTEKDAIAFRECGLGDEGYVDALNTTSIQVAMDRLANALGVQPDEEPTLPA